MQLWTVKPYEVPPMPAYPKIHVTGDAYSAVFYIPPRRVYLEGVNPHAAHMLSLPVGVEYMYRAIRAACNPTALSGDGEIESTPNLTLSRSPDVPISSTDSSPVAFYEIANVGTVHSPALKMRLPLLRFAEAEPRKVHMTALSVKHVPVGTDCSPERPDILVEWLGELGGRTRDIPDISRRSSNLFRASIHLQVGLEALQNQKPDWQGSDDAPSGDTKVRILVVNIGELSASHRIRRSLSYEAIAVDVLRLLRGVKANAAPSPDLKRLWMTGGTKPCTFVLVVRLSNSAVLLYTCNPDCRGKANHTPYKELGAWLLCHKTECAPLSQPELGQMIGCTGFVSSQLAASLGVDLATYPEDQRDARLAELVAEPDKLHDILLRSLRRSLVWQRVAFDRGILRMLFKPEMGKWVPTAGNTLRKGSRTGYEDLFSEITTTISDQFLSKVSSISEAGCSASSISIFDVLFLAEVHSIKIDIQRAVAHRTQWFMARSVVHDWKLSIKHAEGSTDFHESFLRIATSWLSSIDSDDAQIPGHTPPIPIVRIGDAELTDRREVEDFLAIHHALRVYANSPNDKIPLNVAVFGTPGAGKSFAVKQVVKHLSYTYPGLFRTEALTFNLGQFKSLDDLPSAFHLVRNECLSSEIPIVFFDEFDSSSSGQPFGWLKFFLAPMQDGNFYHDGQTYKVGRAVFVFAGGVNRSFEELNGRVRNPGFCEAKGPDFVSRLKAHLNVQGINRPDDEADQARYVLRRGILLRNIVRRRLGLINEQPPAPLLHPKVASALLRLERFKHGVRSLEAIIAMCASRPGYPIGPSDLPSMDQLEMHVDAARLLKLVDGNIGV